MLKNLRQIVRTPGSFAQNVAFMFTASAGGMAIQFLFMPLLSRIYDPEAYGLFGVFNAVLVVLGTAATLGYNQAFVLPKTESAFRGLMSITLRIGLLFSVVVTAVTYFSIDWLVSHDSTSTLGLWWLLLGPLLLLFVVDRVMMDWSIRDKAFKRQSLWSVPTMLVSKGFNVGYGMGISPTADGHILTTALTYVLRIGVYLRWVIPNALQRLLTRSTRESRRQAATEYADYPRFTLWGNLLNVGSSYIPVLLLPIVLDQVEVVGFYTFSLLLLEIPMRLIAGAVTPVYMNKAAELVNQRPDELGPLTFKLFRNLLWPVAIGMGLLYALGEPVYVFAFGEPWRTAGQAAEVLAVFYFFRLVSSPLSPVINIIRKENEVFRFQLGLFIARLLALLPGLFWELTFVELMWLYSVVNAVTYAALNQRIFALIKHRVWRVLLESCVAIGVCLLLAHTLKP